MSFPQFYLHYDAKNDKILAVDRSDKNDNVYVILIPLDESMSKGLLAGSLSEMDIIVNKFANPPYALDRSKFPKNQKFYILFSTDDLLPFALNSTPPNESELKKNNQWYIEVETRIAYSLLNSDTTFADWSVNMTRDGECYLKYSPKDGMSESNVFKNRVDFISLVDLDLRTSKNIDDRSGLKICDIIVDHVENKFSIHCVSNNSEHYQDFFIAITNKNDPSYLIKMIDLKPALRQDIVFSDNKIEDLSFFTSRFHMRNTQVEVIESWEGKFDFFLDQIDDTLKVGIKASLEAKDNNPEVLMVLKDKYDDTNVLRTLKITSNDELNFETKKIDVDSFDVVPLNFSKKLITIHKHG